MIKPEIIVIHHSGTDDGPGLNTQAIRKYHVEVKGWKDIGYHALAEKVGDHYEVLMGRPWWMDGAHTIGQNGRALGFCFIGNFSEDLPTEAQLTAGAKLIRSWMDIYDIPESRVYPHNYFADTDCPGTDFDMDELKAIVRMIKN